MRNSAPIRRSLPSTAFCLSSGSPQYCHLALCSTSVSVSPVWPSIPGDSGVAMSSLVHTRTHKPEVILGPAQGTPAIRPRPLQRSSGLRPLLGSSRDDHALCRRVRYLLFPIWPPDEELSFCKVLLPTGSKLWDQS